MSKAYIVYQSWGTCDDSSILGIFLDKTKANAYVSDHMIPRNKELEQHEKCKICRCCDKADYHCTHDYDYIFNLENDCINAKIGEDRYGKYCENDISDFYSLSTSTFWASEVEIIE